MNAAHADLFVPDDSAPAKALERTTHLGIGAHPDDLELMAWHGITKCHASDVHWFTGVVCCDGAGSPRSGHYADYSDADMVKQRAQEQRQAAELGQYSAQIQLGYSSTQAGSVDTQLVEDLARVIDTTRPDIIYLHNLADAHATHVAIALASLQALRNLEDDWHPQQVFGVEVWRSLDWLPESHRIVLALPADDSLQQRLLACHDSQIRGGKRYDLAIRARQQANATFADSHNVDTHAACCVVLDYSALIDNPNLTPRAFMEQCLNGFNEEIFNALQTSG